MKIKVDASGNAVLSGGMPVFVDDDGKETTVDVPALLASAKEHKSAARQRERELAEATAKLEAASKGGANDAERIKLAYEAQLSEWRGKAEAAEASRAKALVDAALAGSKFLAERVAVPSRMIAAAYRDHIAVEGDKVVVRDARGQVLHSRANPLAPASLDEGLELLITQSPDADRILRGTQLPGSGASATPTAPAGPKTMSGAEFRALDPAQQLAAAKAGIRIA